MHCTNQHTCALCKTCSFLRHEALEFLMPQNCFKLTRQPNHMHSHKCFCLLRLVNMLLKNHLTSEFPSNWWESCMCVLGRFERIRRTWSWRNAWQNQNSHRSPPATRLLPRRLPCTLLTTLTTPVPVPSLVNLEIVSLELVSSRDATTRSLFDWSTIARNASTGDAELTA